MCLVLLGSGRGGCLYSNMEKSNKGGIPSSWSVVVSPTTYRTTQAFLTTIPNLDTFKYGTQNQAGTHFTHVCAQLSCARAENKMSFNMRNPRVCSRLNICDSFPKCGRPFLLCCDLCIWAETLFHMCCIWLLLGTHWGPGSLAASWGGGCADPLTNDQALQQRIPCIDLLCCASESKI